MPPFNMGGFGSPPFFNPMQNFQPYPPFGNQGGDRGFYNFKNDNYFMEDSQQIKKRNIDPSKKKEKKKGSQSQRTSCQKGIQVAKEKRRRKGHGKSSIAEGEALAFAGIVWIWR